MDLFIEPADAVVNAVGHGTAFVQNDLVDGGGLCHNYLCLG